MDETYIEENFVRCTYCGDHKYKKCVLPWVPCSVCNLEEYLEWKKWYEIEKAEKENE